MGFWKKLKESFGELKFEMTWVLVFLLSTVGLASYIAGSFIGHWSVVLTFAVGYFVTGLTTLEFVAALLDGDKNKKSKEKDD